jgi:hypothetical protein
MNTKDILIKPVVDESEMIHVVEDYIRIRKGPEVHIELETRTDAQLLLLAYRSAREWFAHNPNYLEPI